MNMRQAAWLIFSQIKSASSSHYSPTYGEGLQRTITLFRHKGGINSKVCSLFSSSQNESRVICVIVVWGSRASLLVSSVAGYMYQQPTLGFFVTVLLLTRESQSHNLIGDSCLLYLSHVSPTSAILAKIIHQHWYLSHRVVDLLMNCEKLHWVISEVLKCIIYITLSRKCI